MKNNDKKIIKDDKNRDNASSYLETQKEHKDWYSQNTMGKQHGKPKLDMPETKKKAGYKKHSLRKEK